MVRMRGLEPPRCHHHRLLRPARLPVPPHPRTETHYTNRASTVSRIAVRSQSRRAAQKGFYVSIDVCNFDIANSYQSFADIRDGDAANNRLYCMNDYGNRRGHRGSQTYRFFDSKRFVAVHDRPNVRHARHGSSRTSRTSYPSLVRVLDHVPAPWIRPAAPTTERVQKIAISKACFRVLPSSLGHLR